MRYAVAATLVLTVLSAALAAGPADTLVDRPLSQAVTELTAAHAANPADQNTQFALAAAQTCRAVEELAGGLWQHGLLQNGVADNLPFLRLPLPPNPDPKPISADAFDALLARFVQDLSAAEQTLAGIDDPAVKLPLKVGLIKLDLNGDAAGGEISAWELFQDLRNDRAAAEAGQFVIAFDLGDVHWLRGYCHLLSGIAEMMLAYDKKELFERAGHILFPRTQSPYPFLVTGKKPWEFSQGLDASDVVAFIHLWNFPVKDANRLKSARLHLLQTLQLSQASWKAILAETDNEAEWIPNPRQETVMPGMRVTQEMIDAWLAFVADARDVLEGRRLIPFWRADDARGVNIRRVFDEPQPFDLVLWIQGSAAAPYLEEGDLADGQTLRQLERLLGGRAFLFAVWVN